MTAWARDSNGKSFPVEWRGPNIDPVHTSNSSAPQTLAGNMARIEAEAMDVVDMSSSTQCPTIGPNVGWIRMRTIEKSLQLVIDLLGVCASQLEKEAVIRIYKHCWQEFSLWDGTTLTHPEAYLWLSQIIPVSECLLLNEETEYGPCGFRFSSPSDMVLVLDQSLDWREFCVTDPTCSYLIAFSHHDNLCGAGRAEPWVQALWDEYGNQLPPRAPWKNLLEEHAEES